MCAYVCGNLLKFMVRTPAAAAAAAAAAAGSPHDVSVVDAETLQNRIQTK